MNILILSHYPAIHSDEAWLSGLSRAWLEEGSITATEPFFDILPRHPHALKLLFHGLQALWFTLTGYGIFQARALSLLAALASLALFHRILQRLWEEPSRIGAQPQHQPQHQPQAQETTPVPGASPDRQQARQGDHRPLFFTILLSLDPWFLTAAHMARQEIFLIFFLLGGILAALGGIFPPLRTTSGPRKGGTPLHRFSSPFRRGLITGIFPALAIGIHPGAFLLAAALAPVLLLSSPEHGAGALARTVKSLAGFTLSCAAGALFFTGISLLMDPGFFTHYRSFGESVEVFVPWYIKLIRFPDYYIKLFNRHSGTYFLPEIRPLLPIYLAALILPLATLAALSALPNRLLRRRCLLAPPAGIACFNLGLIILGKYGPPLFVLQLPLVYLGLATMFRYREAAFSTGSGAPRRGISLDRGYGQTGKGGFSGTAVLAGEGGGAGCAPGSASLPSRPSAAAPPKAGTGALRLPGAVVRALFLFGMGSVALYNILPTPKPREEHYSDYAASIQALLPAQGTYRVLGNLNAEYALPYGSLLDYRNLAWLEAAGLSLEEYIDSRKITHILYPDEIDQIYRRRPVWNILYGNVVPWYGQMEELLKCRGVLAGSFSSPTYGMRIVPYMGKQEWQVRLYRIGNSPCGSKAGL